MTANKKKKEKKPSRRERITDIIIRCLVAREGIVYHQTNTHSLPSERERAIASRRAELSAAQFDLEKLLFQTTGADHLDGVDRVYGIKRRVLKYDRPAATVTQAAA